MDRRVEKTFREVQGARHWSATIFQTKDAESRESVTTVGCECGSMDSCPFLLLCLQGTDDVKMDDGEMDGVQ